VVRRVVTGHVVGLTVLVVPWVLGDSLALVPAPGPVPAPTGQGSWTAPCSRSVTGRSRPPRATTAQVQVIIDSDTVPIGEYGQFLGRLREHFERVICRFGTSSHRGTPRSGTFAHQVRHDGDRVGDVC
jgi:hypothetical protein